jgi:putative ABC transport system ATP-binding protein
MSSGVPETVIRASDLGKSVAGPDGTITILDGVELAVNRGESVAIVGASGSGKTTLLGLLAGLDLPTRGEVVLAGHNLSALDEEARAALRAGNVGFVFQSFHLLPALTAEENVALPLELSGGGSDGEDRDRVAEVLELVGLTPRSHHHPRQMSGGEQQRVAIARAFVARPRILFADEPTGNLDQATGRQIGDLLFRLNREHGTTLVLVTHDLALARRCGRVLVLDGGRLVEAAPGEPATAGAA